MTAKQGAQGTAVQGIRAFRERAANEVPELREALHVEADAEGFCRATRDGLRTHRKQHGLDQAQLGEAMGLTQSAVSRIERGSGDIGLKTLFRYARALGLKPYITFSPSAVSALGEVAAASPDTAVVAAVAAGLDHEQDRFFHSLSREMATHMNMMTAVVEQMRETEAGALEETAMSLAQQD